MKRYLHGNGFGDNVEQTADMFEEDDMRGIAQETATEILLPKTRYQKIICKFDDDSVNLIFYLAVQFKVLPPKKMTF